MKKFSNNTNTDWREGKSKTGNVRYYRLIDGVWANAVIYPHNKLYITYNNKKIKHNILFDETKKVEILNKVYTTILEEVSKEPKAWEDMKHHEQLAEIGRRENIKFEFEEKKDKQSVFGDGFQL